MKKSFVLGAITIASLLVGCGARPPMTLDSAKSVTVSQGLVTSKPMYISKDAFLDKNEWAYGLYFIPEKSITNDVNAIVPDRMKVKIFYLAHHADAIVLQGNSKNSCEKVIRYLHTEGVTAQTFNQCKGKVRDKGEETIVAMTFGKGERGYKELKHLLKEQK